MQPPSKDLRRGKLRVRIGDKVWFDSAEQNLIEGSFVFLQKNTVKVEDQFIDYLIFDFISNQQIIASKTLFAAEAIQSKSVTLRCLKSSQKYELLYEFAISEITNEEMRDYQKLTQASSNKTVRTQNNELQILRLGSLAYNFAQRIDVLIKVYHEFLSIILWRRPKQTITVGCIASFIVFFPNLSFALFSFFLIVGRHSLFKYLQRMVLLEDPTKRLRLPEENIVFLQNLMRGYNSIFQKFHSVLQNEDRSQLITVVQIVCKLGGILMLIQAFLSLKLILVLGIWGSLIVGSSFGQKLIVQLIPKIRAISTILSALSQKIMNSSIGLALNLMDGTTAELVKQFYIYEHQRWWIGKNWVFSAWADENKTTKMLARTEPPAGYQWRGPWKIAQGSTTDENGYEYSNGLMAKHTASNCLKTTRRRKWVRKCHKMLELKSQDEENQHFS